MCTAVAALFSVLGVPAAAQPAGPAPCTAGWQQTVVARGLGALENLEPDGADGFFVSAILRGDIKHVDAQGNTTVVAGGFRHPAGLRLAGDDLYFVTGDGTSADGSGTLERVNVRTRAVTTLVRGLVQPNGLLRLPDGDLLISHFATAAGPLGISRYRPATGTFERWWSRAEYANGLALAPGGKAIYATNVNAGHIVRIPLEAPSAVTVAGQVRDGWYPGLDDIAVTRSGTVFVTGNIAGRIYRLDPGRVPCIVASDLNVPGAIDIPPYGPTSVRIARDGQRWALFAALWDGTLRKLTPPPDTDLSPAG